jgi:CBS domain-containing protein
MSIADILRSKGREVLKIRPDDQVATAVQVLARHRIGALAVEDEWQRLVGIFSERDLVNALARQGPDALNLQVRELMSSPVITCQPGDRIDAMLAMMTGNKIRHLPVVEAGELIGIVSIGDLIKERLDAKELEAAVLLDLTRLRV